MSSVVFEKRGQQAWITLNRPAAKNMINGDMFVELADAWQEVAGRRRYSCCGAYRCRRGRLLLWRGFVTDHPVMDGC